MWSDFMEVQEYIKLIVETYGDIMNLRHRKAKKDLEVYYQKLFKFLQKLKMKIIKQYLKH